MGAYEEMLARKEVRARPCGFEPGEMPAALFGWQRVVVERACRAGRYAIFADCGLNINPSSDELSEIAIASAHSWSTFMGNVEPHVAMLSYSTMGSAGGEVAKKVQEAVKFCHEKAPELAIDGDLQLDAAIVPTVAQLKAPGSSVAGKANVLVFPDLEAGNIGYKLVQRFAGADAYGPILQGIAKPVNDLSRGCSADDIVGVVAITAVQAQMAE